ncbi:MAG: hypothetical protein JWQ86_5742 [Mycobacterium sp.]|nr:hypothetical protein [Mycobacterium sp.]MDT5214932.1 hypothetical protein [Mycobacterium sp.]
MLPQLVSAVHDVLFFEYFDGDTGAGLGASHQTGWTALVADVIRRRHGSLPSIGEVIARVTRGDDQIDAP